MSTRHISGIPYSDSAEYTSWIAMKSRCKSSAPDKARNYRDRGIRVCDRWESSFAAFYEDMGPKPSAAHTLDRINNDGHYEPGNVRWATPREQSNNTRFTKRITVDGETKSIAAWARVTGLSQNAIRSRILKGWSARDAVFSPTSQLPQKFEDMTGQRFGMLTAVKKVSTSNPTAWLCLCDCGRYTRALRGNIKRGLTRSCGCNRHVRSPRHQPAAPPPPM